MSAPSRVAIVGAGPAGICAADILTRLAPDTQVDLLEKLPNGDHIPGLFTTGWIKRGPVGLIGSTKSDTRQTVETLLDRTVRSAGEGVEWTSTRFSLLAVGSVSTGTAGCASTRQNGVSVQIAAATGSRSSTATS